MRMHVDIGVRVSVHPGDFLPGEHSQRRKQCDLWYDVVSDYVGSDTCRITWDNGRTASEKSSQIQIQQRIEGRYPLLDLSYKCNTTLRPLRNEDEDLIHRFAGP